MVIGIIPSLQVYAYKMHDSCAALTHNAPWFGISARVVSICHLAYLRELKQVRHSTASQ